MSDETRFWKRQEERSWRLRWRNPVLSRGICDSILAEASDDDALARACRTLAWLDKWRGDFDLAEAHLRRALDYFGDAQDYAVGDCQSTLGVILYSRGDYAGAHSACETGLAAIADLPPQEARIDLLVTLSTLHQYSHDFTRCYALLDEAAALAREKNHPMDLSRLEHNRARALLRQDDVDSAFRTARMANRLARGSRNAVIIPYVCEVLGSTLIERGDPYDALPILKEGEEVAIRLGDKRARCQNLEQTGRACTALGRHNEANVALQRGLAFAKAMDYPLWVRKFSHDLSRNYEEMGDYREALRCERDYIAVHRQLFSRDTERRLSEMRNAFELHEAEARSEREARRAEDLIEVARAAEEASHLKTKFLANMSHELRTPLNAILGFVQMLRMTPLTEKQDEYTGIVLSAGQTLLNLISDILDLTQIEAGMAIDCVPFKVMGAIEEASASGKGLVSNKALTFETDIDPALPDHALGDGARVGQILVNFIGNAAKFSKEGAITLTARPHADMIRLSVRDNGPGVPPEKKKEIFLRFQQGDDALTRQHGGTGLGLAICKELMQRMDGKIGVDDAPGGGAEFWILLPLPQSETVAAAPDNQLEPLTLAS